MNRVTRASSSWTVSLPGLLLKVSSTSVDLAAGLRDLFLDESVGTESEDELHIQAEVQEERLDVPDFARAAYEKACEEGFGAELITHGDEGVVAVKNISRGPLIAYYTHDTRWIRLVCYREHPHLPMAVGPPGAVLIPLLRNLLAERERYLLHAAGVRLPDGQGMLLLADNGGGKTTTVLQLARNGAEFLSDDLVIVERNPDGRWTAYGIREKLNCTDQTLAFFPDLAHLKSIPTSTANHLKRPIHPDEIFVSHGQIQSMPIDMICRLVREGRAPRVEHEAAVQFLPSLFRAHCFLGRHRMSAAAFHALVDLALCTRTALFQAGQDPMAIHPEDFRDYGPDLE